MAHQIIEENQQQKDKPTYEDPKLGQNEELVKKVNKLLQQSMDATKDVRPKWAENYKFVVKGEQWSVRRPKWRFSEVFNTTWANIMTEVAIQTDSAPKFEINAAEPSDMVFADILKEINNLNWNKPLNRGFGWSRKTATAIFKSKIYDVVHAEVAWNPKLEGGLGDVDLKILDPFGCFWDHKATNMYENRFFIYAVPEPTETLKKDYPDHADKIKPDVDSMTDGSASAQKRSDHNIDRAGLGQSLAAEPIARGQKNAYGGEEMTLKIRCWLKDDTTIEELVPNKAGGEEYVTKLKYPKGRYIVVVNNCVVEDRENEYDDGLFPIACLLNYDYGEYCGENEVTHLRGPQKLSNYSINHMMDQFKVASAPQKIIAQSAAHVADKITDEPGLKIVVPDMNSIRFESGPGIAPGTFNVIDVIKSYGDQIGGLQDSSRGAPQPGVNSGLMLEGFVEAAQTRPRLKNRSVDEYLRQVGFLCASRYLQFYKVPRTYRITNKEGFPEYVEFYIEDERVDAVTGEEIPRKVKVKRQAFDQSGQPVGDPIAQEGSAKGLPDIDVVAGSNLPYARAQKNAIAGNLFTQGAIPLEEYLTAINWPNAKQVAARMMEQQAAAQAQAAPA
jgi:hypothetical protein